MQNSFTSLFPSSHTHSEHRKGKYKYLQLNLRNKCLITRQSLKEKNVLWLISLKDPDRTSWPQSKTKHTQGHVVHIYVTLTVPFPN